MQPERQIVAYFDFDGTLTSCDTLLPFLRFTLGWRRFITALPALLPILVAYWCRMINNEQAKQRTLTVLLRGKSILAVEQSAKNFALTRLNKYLKPEIYAKLEWHREHGHSLVIVSANLAIYLRYWAQLHKLDYVLATEIEVDEQGQVSGKLATRNCYAEQKVIRIQQFLRENNFKFSYSYAYGNSAGDHELLDYADEAYYVSGNEFEKWKDG